MKRITAILLCLILCLALAACAPEGYLNSTDGDITVSLPEVTTPQMPEFTDEQKLILGKWNLISITTGGAVTNYTDSYYIFEETGKFTAVLNGTSDTDSFSFSDSALIIGGDAVTYTIENNTLTITTSLNKVHLLTKAEDTEA